MGVNKNSGTIRRMKLIIFTALILLVGITPVLASGESYEIIREDFGSIGGEDDETQMFSPTPGYLVVQHEHDGSAKYVVDTELLKYSVDWSTDSDGNTKFNMDLSKPSLSISGTSSDYSQLGFRSVYVNGVDYVFTHDEGNTTDYTYLIMDTFTIMQESGSSDKWNGKWGNRYMIDYPICNLNSPNSVNTMDCLQVVGAGDKIYLISKQIINNVPTLDISYIPITAFEGTSSTIKPITLYQFKNNDPAHPNFNPVPDYELYDVIVTTHMDPDNIVFIGAGDSGVQPEGQSNVETWYIGPNGYGQKRLVNYNENDFKDYGIGSVFLEEGPCQGAETAVNSITAVVVGSTWQTYDSDKSHMHFYNADLPTFAQLNWKLVYNHSGTTPYYMGKNPVTSLPFSVPIENTPNLWSMVAFADVYYDKKDDKDHNFFLSYYASNQLIKNMSSDYGNVVDTSADFNTYGNLAIPVGIIDGVPPFSYNGWDCDPYEVTSEVEISKSSTNTAETSGSNKMSGSISYGKEFLHDKIGLDAEYEYSVINKEGEETEFKNTTTDTFAFCSMPENESVGYFLYFAPNTITNAYNVADFYGNVANSSELIYVTEYDPSGPVSQKFKAYDVTNTSTGGPNLAGLKKSPYIDDFSNWNWATWSGGWYNREWDESPYASNFTMTKFGDSLYWELGGTQKTDWEMTTSTSQSTTVENEVTTTAKLFSPKLTGDVSWEQESSITNAITQGLSFTWAMKSANSDVCGVDDITVIPVILTPNIGADGNPLYCPWVPTLYRAYSPWLLTYTVQSYTPSPGCNLASGANDAKIKTHASPNGSGKIILPAGGIERNATGLVQAVPSDGYTFLYWEAYGIDLDDYSSLAANATVKSMYSSLYAYFGKKSSDLVNSGIIEIANESFGNQVKIQGTLPAGFTKFHALHQKEPIVIKIGDLTYPFGQTVSTMAVVSDHEIAYQNKDTKNGNSYLRVDLGTRKWWFAADNVLELARLGPDSNQVNVGFRGKNLSVDDDILLTGTERVFWSGKNEPVSNEVFSLQNATLIGNIHFQNTTDDYNGIILQNGELKVSSITETTPLLMRIHGIEIRFDKPTSINGDILTYQKSWKDLTATITINKKNHVLNAGLYGKRLSHKYIDEGISIGLQIGGMSASEVIHPSGNTHLMTQNLVNGLEKEFLAGMNFNS